MVKRSLLTLLSILLLTLGITAILYPTLSDRVVRIEHQQLIRSYEVEIQSVSNSFEVASLDAEEYNNIVRAYGGYGFIPTEQNLALYNRALNSRGDGMMGYISIPDLEISLPIYHTSDDAVLQVGIGHIESTSLPIGGTSNHSVLTGHSGLSSAKMFSEIDGMAVGDIFILNISGRALYYEVYNIVTVLPDETELLAIQDGRDLCTLITCTPYGVNTHRLLVQGERVDFDVDVVD